ncbi:MAG: hypothetical protein IK139_04615 [Lachnospiraceae bacterium]|nr:hypothetical protein [Lachnospiraceae bacterium]
MSETSVNKTDRKKGISRFIICELVIALAAPVFGLLIMLVSESSATVLIKGLIGTFILSAALAFVLYRAVRSKDLLYDNLVNMNRFMICYLACALIAALSAVLPEFIVPLAALGFICAVLSNGVTGIFCSLIFCAMPLLINGKSFEYFLFSFSTCLAVILLVLIGRDIREKAVPPMVIFSLAFITLYTALIVLKRTDIVWSVIINPAAGLILDVVIVSFTIYAVRKNIILANEEKYDRIVDPEHPLLLELKEKDKKEYKRSIHTAYICDRLSDKLGFNRALMKGAGFYHRIGVLSNNNMSIADATVHMVKRENFPWPLVKILEQYGNDALDEIPPEASLLCIADTVINEVLLRMEKGEEDIDYEKLIDRVINTLIGSKNGRLQKSGLKIQHLYRIRKYLKEEKLYYDFLR